MHGKTISGDSHISYNCYCDIGVRQRLFWPEAVCFQDMKTSAGGIPHSIFAVIVLFVSHNVCLIVDFILQAKAAPTRQPWACARASYSNSVFPTR